MVTTDNTDKSLKCKDNGKLQTKGRCFHHAQADHVVRQTMWSGRPCGFDFRRGQAKGRGFDSHPG